MVFEGQQILSEYFFVDENFVKDEQNVCMKNMTLPCILNKTAIACSKSILYFSYRIITARIQNDMHHILWVLQFTLGQSVIHLLLAPPVPI